MPVESKRIRGKNQMVKVSYKSDIDREKYKALVHYICDVCGDPSKLGATKLNKILWLSDALAYAKLGQSITGERYVKRQFGPAPYNFLGIREELEQEGKIAVRYGDYFGRTQTQFFSLQRPEISDFKPEEIDLVSGVINAVCAKTAKEISDWSHADIWKVAEYGEDIPHYALFVWQLGEIDEDSIAWADQEIAKIAA